MRTRNGCRTPRPPELAGWVERSEAHLSRASRGRWASFVSPPCEAAEAPARWRTTIPVGATLVVAPIWHPRRIPGRHGIAVRGGHGDRPGAGGAGTGACPYGGIAGNRRVRGRRDIGQTDASANPCPHAIPIPVGASPRACPAAAPAPGSGPTRKVDRLQAHPPGIRPDPGRIVTCPHGRAQPPRPQADPAAARSRPARRAFRSRQNPSRSLDAGTLNIDAAPE